MKVTFWPKKETVLAILQLRIEEASANVAEYEAKQEAIKGKKNLIVQPGEESMNYTLLQGWKDTLSELQDKRTLIKSSSKPHVLCETEV